MGHGISLLGLNKIINIRMRNAEKLEKLLSLHKDYLFHLAYRLTGAKDRAEDLVHDLIVDIYTRQVNTDDIRYPKAWLSKVIYRMFADKKKREKKTITLANMEGLVGDNEGLLSHEDKGHDAAEETCNQSALIAALEQLNPDQRSVLLLHDVEGYSLVELHELTHVPLGTLKSRLHRARNSMQTILTTMELV